MNLKTILLLVSSISLLAGCNKASSEDKPTLIPDTNTGEVDTGVTDTGSEDTTPSIDTNTDTGETTGTVTDNTYTTPEGFASTFKAGYQFDITSGSQDLLKNAMDPEGKIISSIETSNITIQEHIQIGGEKNLELTIGTGKADGAITFNVASPLKAVSFTLQSYSKYIDYSSSYSRDAAPTVTINQCESKTLSPASNGENPLEEYAVSFADAPVNKVVLKNDAGAHRVFIKSVTFTF